MERLSNGSLALHFTSSLPDIQFAQFRDNPIFVQVKHFHTLFLFIGKTVLNESAPGPNKIETNLKNSFAFFRHTKYWHFLLLLSSAHAERFSVFRMRDFLNRMLPVFRTSQIPAGLRDVDAPSVQHLTTHGSAPRLQHHDIQETSQGNID